MVEAQVPCVLTFALSGRAALGASALERAVRLRHYYRHGIHPFGECPVSATRKNIVAT